MDMYKYEFSVITAVHNAEDYLKEAVESLISQTIGFKNIQLVMIDDGSTDNSGAICDEYVQMYPENVVVIHRENGGKASARNEGIPYAEGRYVTFMDPEDTLSSGAMEAVKLFMDDEGLKADMCCIPIYFFGKKKGNHPLNTKFVSGTRLVSMLEVKGTRHLVLDAVASFFRLETAGKMEFDTQLYRREDAKEILKILINNPYLGLVTGVRYNRRRYGKSAADSTVQHEESKVLLMRRYYRWIMEQALEKYGYVPLFVQNSVMRDLKSILQQKDLPSDIISDEVAAEFQEELFATASMFDYNTLLRQKVFYKGTRIAILQKKYNRAPKLKLIKKCSHKHEYTKNDIVLTYNNRKIAAVSEMRMVWQFLEIDKSRNECIVEGHCNIYGLDAYGARPVVIADGTAYECDSFRMEERETRCVGKSVSCCLGFKGTIPLKETTRINLGLKIKDIVVISENSVFGKFFPVSDYYSNAYAFINGYIFTVRGKSLRISHRAGLRSRYLHEYRFLKEIWEKKPEGERDAVAYRIVYQLVKPILKKQIWLISDRIMKADDNGEALFRYLLEYKPEGVIPVFLIRKESEDYPRIRKLGRCVGFMSRWHKMLFLLCTVPISSGAENVMINPFGEASEDYRDLLTAKKFVFLQHGITENDCSRWLKRYDKNIKGFVTAAFKERESILNGRYYYGEDVVWLSGFPRYDRLYHSENKKITIMPTWRKYLLKQYDTETGIWIGLKSFVDSDYYKFYDELINSERLLSTLQEYGYTLQFFLHPNMRGYLGDFHHDSRVRFLSTETMYRDVYAESELVVTDYSSAVFDFSYLRKPIIYCQFDLESFYSGNRTLNRGYFDFEKNGFGEVVYDLDSTIDMIIEYVKDGCRLKDRYRKRIDSFFAYDDQNNCRRVVDHILELSKE